MRFGRQFDFVVRVTIHASREEGDPLSCVEATASRSDGVLHHRAAFAAVPCRPRSVKISH